MDSSRILGGMLCVASALVAALHVFFGYVKGPRIHLAFALPVTVILLVATGLGFWLGWIMVTTKESSPTPEPEEEPEESED